MIKLIKLETSKRTNHSSSRIIYDCLPTYIVYNVLIATTDWIGWLYSICVISIDCCLVDVLVWNYYSNLLTLQVLASICMWMLNVWLMQCYVELQLKMKWSINGSMQQFMTKVLSILLPPKKRKNKNKINRCQLTRLAYMYC